MTKVGENFINILTSAYDSERCRISICYAANSDNGVSVIDADDFRAFLMEEGIGSATVSLDHYYDKAPSNDYIHRDLERYMFYKVEQAEINRAAAEEHNSRAYYEQLEDDRISYQRNYSQL